MMQPLKIAVAGFAMSLVMTAVGTAQTNLDAYRWKARPLLVIAPNAEDPSLKQQQAEIEAHKAGMAERDMVVVIVTRADDPLRKTFGRDGQSFQVLLVGKDGHVAERWSSPVKLTSVFALIDRMPMRRDEMRREK